MGVLLVTFPQANLLDWYEKKSKPNTTKTRIHQSKEMYYNTKWTQNTKARFSRYTHTRLTALFRDYPGEPVPEK